MNVSASAGVVKLVYTLALGACGEIRGGSSPLSGTKYRTQYCNKKTSLSNRHVVGLVGYEPIDERNDYAGQESDGLFVLHRFNDDESNKIQSEPPTLLKILRGHGILRVAAKCV